MTAPVTIEIVAPKHLAAVRRRTKAADIMTAFKPALDQVRDFLREHPGLHQGGPRVLYYHHRSGTPEAGMDVDFGVEVSGHFDGKGGVSCVTTPGGHAAVLVHRGFYAGLPETHQRLHRWFQTNGQLMGTWSLEIYGDWHEDEGKLETTIVYAMA
jgi:effector-binding domain-containing protein